jgi:NCAIR mutase (PurE)-related protein
MVRLYREGKKDCPVIGTKATEGDFAAVRELALAELGEEVPARLFETAGMIALGADAALKNSGEIAVLTAGTSDLPIAEEAAVLNELYGNTVKRYYDIGVAGLHRLLNRIEEIRQAKVIIAVAGMDGALPSVVSGLVSVPVIAVPTSVGYGANFGGMAALLTMLNSCALGVSVVNIDNGIGAGYLAALMC